jgi:DNA-binding transcriptional LysR family regulator
MAGMGQELRHLRYFVEAAAELNFTRAAERLSVTQQSLSAGVRQLELQVGAQLFERTTRKVELTAAGTAMLPRARQLLALADEIFDAGPAEPGPRLLTVDVSTSGLETGSRILRQLRETNPEIGIRQVDYGVPRGVEALLSGELDVLFGNAVQAAEEVSVELVRLEPIQVMVSAGHPLAAAAAVPVRALAGAAWLLPADEFAPEWNEQVINLCQQAGFLPRRYPGVTPGPLAAAELVVEDRCVVPTLSWPQPPPGVVLRPLVQPAECYPWSMMWVDALRTPATSTLLAAARAAARANGWRTESGVAAGRPG